MKTKSWFATIALATPSLILSLLPLDVSAKNKAIIFGGNCEEGTSNHFIEDFVPMSNGLKDSWCNGLCVKAKTPRVLKS